MLESQDLCLNQNALVQQNVCFLLPVCSKRHHRQQKQNCDVCNSVATKWLRDWEPMWWSMMYSTGHFFISSSHSLSLLIPWDSFPIQHMFASSVVRKVGLVNQGHDSFKLYISLDYTGVSKNRCTPKSSILIGFSIINHPFWGTPIFGNTHTMPWKLELPQNFMILRWFVWGLGVRMFLSPISLISLFDRKLRG